jgi:hypothetical protein
MPRAKLFRSIEMNVMLECGHAANATDKSGAPVCAICIGIHPGATVVAKSAPDLTGRIAKCGYCGKEAPSSTDLAFFEYQGADTYAASWCRHCGFTDVAHKRADWTRCKAYEPRGDVGHDRFYCGCRGWD